MRKLMTTTIAALAAIFLAGVVSAADVPTRSSDASVTHSFGQSKQLKKERVSKIRGARGQFRTRADEETAPLNPPAAPREWMVSPARPAVK